jgi:hypothetical protein
MLAGVWYVCNMAKKKSANKSTPAVSDTSGSNLKLKTKTVKGNNCEKN